MTLWSGSLPASLRCSWLAALPGVVFACSGTSKSDAPFGVEKGGAGAGAVGGSTMIGAGKGGSSGTAAGRAGAGRSGVGGAGGSSGSAQSGAGIGGAAAGTGSTVGGMGGTGSTVSGAGPMPGFGCSGTTTCKTGERCVDCNEGEIYEALCAPDPDQDPSGYRAATAACLTILGYTECDGPEDCAKGEYCAYNSGANYGAKCQSEPATAPASCCFICDATPVCTLCWNDTDCPVGYLCMPAPGAPNGVGGCRVAE
jgi:hypothetical protein